MCFLSLHFYPKIQINHSYNMDSIYGGYKRFNWPINLLIKKLYPQYSREFMGEVENSKYFWGDLHKKIIFFSRNHEFSDIITSNIDDLMPYKDPKRSKYANYWFSSTFAPNQKVFKHVMSNKNIDRLEKSNGTSIIYTHFGYFVKNGQLDTDFIKSIEYLSKKKNGIFKPVSKILNDIASEREQNGKTKFPNISYLKKFQYEIYHLLTRIYFRKIFKIDDYGFKNLNKEMFTK